jgi:DeoR/GlpR family transcriptional regulator of sugar metabolism
MADKQSRMQRMLLLLSESKTDTIKNLAFALNVSEMTVRRDVDYLEQAGYLKSFHGGVSLVESQGEELTSFRYTPYMFNKEDKERLAEKKRIAEYAVSFVESFDAIGIDNGTTCRYLLDYLPGDLNCMLYTYSMEVLSKAVDIASRSKGIFCYGGLYHRTIKMFESMDVVEMIKRTHIDKLFLGAVGISHKHGLSCAQQYEREMRRAIMSVSDRIFVLADSSKIDKTWYLQYGSLQEVDMLITDSKITDAQRKSIEDAGLEVHVV